jgi:mRNA interferase YafQ
MLTADYTGQFRKDYILVIKRGYDITLLDSVIQDLVNERPLDAKYKDHPLYGNYKDYRECHIKNDWLLIYRIANNVVVFYRTGTHSDVF